eukprot:maker-scaffold_34-snap-gene-3.16-mRNA-1 protein AED:0.01 eAED:0.01 QI:0/0/0.5/1/0/0/2/285/263
MLCILILTFNHLRSKKNEENFSSIFRWAQQNIKHKKQRADDKKAVLNSKFSREVRLAVKQGNSVDPNENFILANVIKRANKASVPKSVIEKALNDKSAADLVEVLYEGTSLCGSQFMVDCVTDNNTRTYNEVKHIFSKHEGVLVGVGALGYNFDHVGKFVLRSEFSWNEDYVLDILDKVDGIIDFEVRQQEAILLSEKSMFHEVLQALENLNLEIDSNSLTREPKSLVTIDQTSEKGETLLNLLEKLDDHEDVAEVHTNISFN